MLVKAVFSNFIKKENGISLIEVAIGLVILGLIVSPLIQIYKVDMVRISLRKTRGELVNIRNAINQYYGSGNGAYPCPASLILGEGDPNFGVSGDCTLANIRLCSDSNWRVNEGICKTEDTSNAVIIGAVPFSTIHIQQENALDYWGNKIIYAVTFEQTNSSSFNSNSGQIRVNTVDNPREVYLGVADGVPDEKYDDIDFFLFSTGYSARGGFTKDGIALLSCPPASQGFDSENCDFDNLFFYDEDPEDNSANAFSLSSGAQFFDDITLGQISVPEAMWFQHPDNGTYVNGDFVITLNEAVGIGTTTPSRALDVIGDIMVEGSVETDSICDNNEICFDPELITGTRSEMRCNEQAVVNISSNSVNCGSAIYSDDTSIPPDLRGEPVDGRAISVDTSVIRSDSCDEGELVSGISASGGIICSIP